MIRNEDASLRRSAAADTGMGRRMVLKASLASGAALLIFGRLDLVRAAAPEGGKRSAVPVAVNAWVRIASDNSVTLIASQSEMGQGITTTLAAALAEEIGIEWSNVKVEFSPFGEAYRHPVYKWMFTGNSESVTAFYELMRHMGAAARERLVAAAARRLGVAPETLALEHGTIRHKASGRSLGVGEVAAEAAQLAPPKEPQLKAPRELALIGRALPRWDIPAKVDGSAVFGIDVVVPDMLLAAVRCAPAFGGKLLRYDAAAIRAKPGVVATVEVPGGLAVVAVTYWQARQALDAAQLEWSNGEGESVDSASLAERYRDKLATGPFHLHKSVGDAAAALAAAGQRIEATYAVPFQAHATMEPMNCTARVAGGECEVWAPTQGVEMALGVAQQVTGLPAGRISIHRTFLGGGFGRRLVADFVQQALIVAKTVGRPVKLIWSREEDMTHDFYRPAMLHRMTGGLDAQGVLTALAHRVVSPSHLLYVFVRTPQQADWLAPMQPPPQYDEMAVEGLVRTRYDIPNLAVEQHYLELPIPVSVWRTTGHGPNNFALECFVDELAAAAKQDPLAFRRGMLARDLRARKVLDLAAAKGDWGQPLPQGHGRGIAFAQAFGGLIAQTAEVSVVDGKLHVHRIVSAVDCGKILDPGIAASNIAGGIVWGLSGLRTAVTFARGRTVQSNFDEFEPLHLWETPKTEVHFIDSGEALGGIGEIGPVPTHAAVCNAIHAATGQRIRTLPLSQSGLTLS